MELKSLCSVALCKLYSNSFIVNWCRRFLHLCLQSINMEFSFDGLGPSKVIGALDYKFLKRLLSSKIYLNLSKEQLEVK